MASIGTTTALLQALIRGPSYGLDLMDRVSDMTKGEVNLSQGATYAALREMEAAGFLKSYLGDEKLPERAGRPRRYFELTAKGRKAAMEDRSVAASLFGLPEKVRAFIGGLVGAEVT